LLAQPRAFYKSQLTSLPLHYRGKVRDIYKVDSKHFLIVASDRLSAFDVVLPTDIPEKGIILTAISNFWFKYTQDVIVNHLQLAEKNLLQAVPDVEELKCIQDRAVVASKLTMLPIEAIVRGYLAGSGWKEYKDNGAIAGIDLPEGLRIADCLPEPIYTPSTKAGIGSHDLNINFDQTVNLVGPDLAEKIRTVSLKLYEKASAYALSRGIIIADSKFEFGIDAQNRLVLADELLTPDSSRFWPLDRYQPGSHPPSYDKQFVRDYLETLPWNKVSPGPELPIEVQNETAAIYKEALQCLIKK
jgi:phosphoribosylaminoimidazole-succinocarboxamide synthase